MPAGTLVHRVQPYEIVLDDLRQRPLDAGAGHVDQDVHPLEQPVDDRGIAEVAVADVLARAQRGQRPPTAGGAQVDAAVEQGRPQHPADVPARPRQGHLGHDSSFRSSGRRNVRPC
jgi:hypothetical protein